MSTLPKEKTANSKALLGNKKADISKESLLKKISLVNYNKKRPMTTELSADDILKEVESGDFGDENEGAEDIKEEKLEDIISEPKPGENNSAEKILENLPTLKKEKNIVWLKEIGKNDVPIVGGKGANLGEMFNSGFPVPPAFVITASAFNNFIVETRLKEKIMSIIGKIDMENTTQLEKEAKHIQQMIVSQEMPADLGKEILRAYDQLDTTLDVDNSCLLYTSPSPRDS